MDRISIKGLEIFANHGVFKEENVLGQKFVINIDMYTSTPPVCSPFYQIKLHLFYL